MEILDNPVALSSPVTTRPGVGPGPAGLRLGQILDALVTATGVDGLTRLRVGNSDLLARTQTPLQPGQRLHLEVIEGGAVPLLRIRDAADPQTPVVAALRRVLPRMAPLAQVFQALGGLAAEAEAAPPLLRDLLAQVRERLPRPEQAMDPQGLRRLMSESGLWREASIAHGRPPVADLKQALAQAAERVRAQAPAADAQAGQAEQPRPPAGPAPPAPGRPVPTERTGMGVPSRPPAGGASTGTPSATPAGPPATTTTTRHPAGTSPPQPTGTPRATAGTSPPAPANPPPTTTATRSPGADAPPRSSDTTTTAGPTQRPAAPPAAPVAPHAPPAAAAGRPVPAPAIRVRLLDSPVQTKTQGNDPVPTPSPAPAAPRPLPEEMRAAMASRHLPRKAEDPRREEPTSSTLRLLRAIEAPLESALARVRYHQLASLPGHDPNVQVWQFEFPLASGERLEGLRLRIEEQERSHADPAAHRWSVTLDFDFAALGRIQARVGLQGERVSGTFWSERSDTLALIQGEMERLRAALESKGLEVSRLGAHRGRGPADTMDPVPGPLLSERA